MRFTFDNYLQLLHLLQNKGYSFCSYKNYKEFAKCVIMRHDIDYDLSKAVEFAKVEYNFGIKSTYFVLLSSDFYNPASKSSYNALHTIAAMGHDIGLHFDETIYDYAGHDIGFYIAKEARILAELLGIPIESFSLHRPNVHTIESELMIPGFVNSYSQEFFKEFKYLSDSRRHWREPVLDIINSCRYDKLHILTHSFWYNDCEADMKETVVKFLKRAEIDRRKSLDENITDLDAVLRG